MQLKGRKNPEGKCSRKAIPGMLHCSEVKSEEGFWDNVHIGPLIIVNPIVLFHLKFWAYLV